MPVPDFSPGEVWTAQAADSIGMWLVKTQTVGAGVASVTVTAAFNADYENYKIIYTGGTKSVNGTMFLQFGSATTGYYSGWNGRTYANTAVVGAGANAANTGVAFEGTTDAVNGEMNVYHPFLTYRTSFYGSAVSLQTGGYAYDYGGYVNATTSFSAFTIFAQTGTLTGGTIRVYGYRN